MTVGSEPSRSHVSQQSTDLKGYWSVTRMKSSTPHDHKSAFCSKYEHSKQQHQANRQTGTKPTLMQCLTTDLPVINLARLVGDDLGRQIGGGANPAGGSTVLVCILAKPKVSQLQPVCTMQAQFRHNQTQALALDRHARK